MINQKKIQKSDLFSQKCSKLKHKTHQSKRFIILNTPKLFVWTRIRATKKKKLAVKTNEKMVLRDLRLKSELKKELLALTTILFLSVAPDPRLYI